jgi:hypothetical protein
MTLADEFRTYAADCDRMVHYTRDPEGKAIWKRMAARWQRAAELEEKHGGQHDAYAPLHRGDSEFRRAL